MIGMPALFLQFTAAVGTHANLLSSSLALVIFVLVFLSGLHLGFYGIVVVRGQLYELPLIIFFRHKSQVTFCNLIIEN